MGVESTSILGDYKEWYISISSIPLPSDELFKETITTKSDMYQKQKWGMGFHDLKGKKMALNRR